MLKNYIRIIRLQSFNSLSPSTGRQMITKNVLHSRQFRRIYLIVSGLVLLLSTLLWSVLGARLQNSNADEGVVTFLFHSPVALPDDYLPSAHSFILKWPLFFLLRVFGDNQHGLVILTVVTTLLTVCVFAWILSRIERRPMVLGTIWLLLSAALIMVPAVPAPGNLLPVNMAMLDTRNIEYILYIAVLWLMIRYHNLTNWRFWAGVAMLAVLIASDKLFLVLAIGGAIGLAVSYALSRNNIPGKMVVKLLAGAVSAAIIAEIGLALISATDITNLVGNKTTGPYGLALSAHSITLGLIYAIVSLATVMGANPAFHTTVLAQMPKQALSTLWGWVGPVLLINIITWLAASWLTVKLLIRSFRGRDEIVSQTASERTALFMVWSTLAALLAYVLTKHYFAGDARYLVISTFTLFIVTALYSRQREWPVALLSGIGLIVIIAIVLAVPAVLRQDNNNRAAFSEINRRNAAVAAIMNHHKSYVLVGDYWRVIPIKLQHTSVEISPLENCTDARPVLTRSDWQHDLHHTDFAYLLSLDRSLTDFPACSMNIVEQTYGRPTAISLVAGTMQQPLELLLLYDAGNTAD